MGFDYFLDPLASRVTPVMNEELSLRYTEAKVLTALSDMNPSTTSGPNGMSPVFFQKYWHMVGSSRGVQTGTGPDIWVYSAWKPDLKSGAGSRPD